MDWFTTDHFKFALYILLGLAGFCRYLQRREHFRLRLGACAAVILAAALFVPRLELAGPGRILYEMGMHAVLLCLFIMGGCLVFAESLRDIILKVFASITVLSVLNFLNGFLTAVFGAWGWSGVVLDIFYLAVYAALFLAARLLHGRGEPSARNERTLVIFVVIVITFALCGTSVSSGVGSSYDFNSPLGVFMLGAYTLFEALCVSLVVIFTREAYLFDDNILLNRILENERKQYELSRENIETINLKYHDLKHIIGLLRASNGSFPAEELESIEESIDSYGAMLKTGCEALDVVIAEKNLICRKRGISLTCIADGSAIGFMSKTDIYVLFGNILGNAIEAVEQIEDEGKRVISLSVCLDTGVIRIREKNCRPAVELELVDGLPQTTKGDTAYHGFGTKSIKAIAEKYEGAVNINVTDEFYTLNVAIPVP